MVYQTCVTPAVWPIVPTVATCCGAFSPQLCDKTCRLRRWSCISKQNDGNSVRAKRPEPGVLVLTIKGVLLLLFGPLSRRLPPVVARSLGPQLCDKTCRLRKGIGALGGRDLLSRELLITHFRVVGTAAIVLWAVPISVRPPCRSISVK